MKFDLLSSERPSSYPGIWKYAGGSGPGLQNDEFDWMKGKRQNDSLNGLWRVHDKLYDLNTFIKYHPGGGDWLDMSRGTDVTEAFEVSHIQNPEFVERTLDKYFVRDAPLPRVSPYTFHDHGFYKVLKRKVSEVVKEIGTGPTVQIRLMMDILVVTFFLMTFLATHFNSIQLQISTGLCLSMTIIAAHNFLHIRQNWRRFYFDLSGLGSYEYRISHVFSHHFFPNTIMDFEISSVEPILEFLPRRNKSWIQCHGPLLYNHAVYLSYFLIAFVKRWKRICKSEQNFRPENVLIFVHLIFCLLVGPSILSSVTSWVTIHITASYFFGLIGFNAAHHHPEIFHDGDEARVDPDFGLCQLDAVRDRSDSLIRNSLFVQLVSFGEHSLHHLFPTICNSKLVNLRPVLEETLIEFGEEFPAISQFDFFFGSLAQLRRTRRHGIEERKSSLRKRS